jgi:hypothetical protein
MTIRKVKRLLNESDDWLVFTMKKVNEDEASMGAYYRNLESWEILLNLAVNDYHIRETLRNVITTADAYRDQQAEDASE